MSNAHTRVLGVDVGGSSVKMGMLDPERGLLDISKTDTIVDAPEEMADLICSMVSRYDAEIIGVGTAGMVNQKTGLVSASNLGWHQIAFRHMLEHRLHKPVWVDNDAQAAMMAEVHSGVLTGARCAVYITLGTGVGGALLIDGKPWRGDDNTAFELGHLITRADGELCSCGRRGCLECYASSPALSRMAGGRSSREVIDGVISGAPDDVKVFDLYIYELCIGLLSLISLFGPDVIAIGGGVSAAGAALIDGINRRMEELLVVRRSLYKLNVKLAIHRNNAGMIGAAALARHYLL